MDSVVRMLKPLAGFVKKEAQTTLAENTDPLSAKLASCLEEDLSRIEAKLDKLLTKELHSAIEELKKAKNALQFNKIDLFKEYVTKANDNATTAVKMVDNLQNKLNAYSIRLITEFLKFSEFGNDIKSRICQIYQILQDMIDDKELNKYIRQVLESDIFWTKSQKIGLTMLCKFGIFIEETLHNFAKSVDHYDAKTNEIDQKNEEKSHAYVDNMIQLVNGNNNNRTDSNYNNLAVSQCLQTIDKWCPNLQQSKFIGMNKKFRVFDGGQSKFFSHMEKLLNCKPNDFNHIWDLNNFKSEAEYYENGLNLLTKHILRFDINIALNSFKFNCNNEYNKNNYIYINDLKYYVKSPLLSIAEIILDKNNVDTVNNEEKDNNNNNNNNNNHTSSRQFISNMTQITKPAKGTVFSEPTPYSISIYDVHDHENDELNSQSNNQLLLHRMAVWSLFKTTLGDVKISNHAKMELKNSGIIIRSNGDINTVPQINFTKDFTRDFAKDFVKGFANFATTLTQRPIYVHMCAPIEFAMEKTIVTKKYIEEKNSQVKANKIKLKMGDRLLRDHEKLCPDVVEPVKEKTRIEILGKIFKHFRKCFLLFVVCFVCWCEMRVIL